MKQVEVEEKIGLGETRVGWYGVGTQYKNNRSADEMSNWDSSRCRILENGYCPSRRQTIHSQGSVQIREL